MIEVGSISYRTRNAMRTNSRSRVHKNEFKMARVAVKLKISFKMTELRKIFDYTIHFPVPLHAVDLKQERRGETKQADSNFEARAGRGSLGIGMLKQKI